MLNASQSQSFQLIKFVTASRSVLGVLSVTSLFSFAQARETAATKEMFKSCWLVIVFLILMAAGASGSGSARGQRGRGGGGRASERGQRGGYGGRGNRDGRHCHDEDDGEYIDEDDDDEGERGGDVRFGRAPRSICWGNYKNKPVSGQPKIGVVHFIGDKCIKEPKYKKTLKMIVRMNMEPNTMNQSKATRGDFLQKCINEFREFYDYPSEYITRKDDDSVDYTKGDNVVMRHLKTNFKQYMNCEKVDADNRVINAHESGNTTATRRTYKPHYFSDPTWEALNVYWDSEMFNKKSENGKQARSNDMEENSSTPPNILAKFDASYKKKNVEVDEIGQKLKEVVDASSQPSPSSSDLALSPCSRRKHEVQLMLQVRSPKKGKMLMYPRHTVSEILGEEEAFKWVSSQSTLACIPERLPNDAYSIIGRVMTEVADMVEAIEEIEVPRARLDEEVQRLATGAYPDRDDPASRALWDEYIRIAASMIDSLFQRFKKVILEGIRVEKAPMDPYEDDDDIARRYPL